MAILFLAIFSWVTYNYNSAYLLSVTEGMQSQLMNTQRRLVSTLVQRYQNVFFNLVIDKKFRQLLFQLEQGRDSKLSREIIELFRSHSTNDSDILNIYLESSSGTNVTFNRSSIDLRNLWDNADFAANAKERCDSSMFVQYFADERYIDTVGQIFHMGITLRDFYTKKPIGYLFVTLSSRGLIETMSSDKPDAYTSGFFENIIYTEEGVILCHSNTSYIGHDISEAVQADNPYRTVLKQRIGKGRLLVVSILDHKLLLADTEGYNRSMLLICVALIIVYVAITSRLLYNSRKTFNRLLYGIDAVQQGRFEVISDHYGADEFNTITEAFNTMVKRLSEMDKDREQKNIEKLRALDMRYEAEVVALESQINSHFLANSINVISSAAVESNNHKVARLLKALSSCMRYTFEKSAAPVPISLEIRWLEHYLMLQKERHGKRFDYYLSCDPKLLEQPIIKLILQPFVENAIMHGFSELSFGGILEIKLRPLRDKIIAVSIYDNGKGIPPALLAQIRETLRDDGMWQHTAHIGMQNVAFRISRYYSGAKIIIRSNGCGVKVNLFLPPVNIKQ